MYGNDLSNQDKKSIDRWTPVNDSDDVGRISQQLLTVKSVSPARKEEKRIEKVVAKLPQVKTLKVLSKSKSETKYKRAIPHPVIRLAAEATNLPQISGPRSTNNALYPRLKLRSKQFINYIYISPFIYDSPITLSPRLSSLKLV